MKHRGEDELCPICYGDKKTPRAYRFFGFYFMLVVCRDRCGETE